MKPNKPGSATSPEYQRFEDMLKTVLSVSPEEMKRRVDAEKKSKKKPIKKKHDSRD
jgi:hypothetical protein